MIRRAITQLLIRLKLLQPTQVNTHFNHFYFSRSRQTYSTDVESGRVGDTSGSETEEESVEALSKYLAEKLGIRGGYSEDERLEKVSRSSCQFPN